MPAYILPIFPALAVLLALKFFREEDSTATAPDYVWRILLACSMLPAAIFPLVLKYVFHAGLPKWLNRQPEIVAVQMFFVLSVFWPTFKWRARTVAASAAALALIGFFVVVAELPQFETDLRRNQTLKPLGAELAKNFRPGDALIVWERLPEGLPMYAGGAISATNRPYLGGMDLTQVPFAFPGNRERLGDLFLPDEAALQKLLVTGRRILIVGPTGTFEKLHKLDDRASPDHLIARVGQWQLFSNQ